MKKIQIDFKKLTDFSVLGSGILGLPLSWYVLYYLLGTISKYILVPWDMTLSRPSGKDWMRMINDYFDKSPGSEVVPAALVIASILVCYFRWKKEKDYYLPIFFTTINILFGIASYVIISLMSKIIALLIAGLGYGYGFLDESTLSEFKKTLDYFGYIKSVPMAIAFMILIWKYIDYLKYENINLFLGIQRKMWSKVSMPDQPITDILRRNINDFRTASQDAQSPVDVPRRPEPAVDISQYQVDRSFRKENVPSITLPKPNIQGMNRADDFSENVYRPSKPKIRLPIVGMVKPYIKMDRDNFKTKDKRRYTGKIKFFN